jgi:hypothetical protein
VSFRWHLPRVELPPFSRRRFQISPPQEAQYGSLYPDLRTEVTDQENEPPFFCFPSEEEIAAKVKCPLHGNRFRQPIFHIYVAKWRRESEKKTPTTPEPQYQKAWLASLPEDLVSQTLATTDSLAR